MNMSECTETKDVLKRAKRHGTRSSELHSARSHLLRCEKCRKYALGEDPLLIFSLLSLQKKEDRFWKGHWDRIAREVLIGKVWPWRIPFLQPSSLAAACTVVVAVTLISVIAILNIGRREWTAQQIPIPAEYTLSDEAVLASQAPIVDTTMQPAAKVITLSVGDADVIMIFDENMDI